MYSWFFAPELLQALLHGFDAGETEAGNGILIWL
jgi:hypothetical protein